MKYPYPFSPNSQTSMRAILLLLSLQ